MMKFLPGIRRLAALFCLAIVFPANSLSATVPVPKGMTFKGNNILALLDSFVGIPYRNDGGINEQGEYTLFADESRKFSSPGLNCSGFVLGAGRFIVNDNISLTNAKKDRFNDSGVGSSLGEDWDFGWDLVLNMSEGRNARLLLQDGGTANPLEYTGSNVPMIDLHAKHEWDRLMQRIHPGNLYLVDFSKPVTITGYSLLHYHVALLYAENEHIWMYQTTNQNGKVYRRDMADKQERFAFLKAFANTGKARKKVAVVEIPIQR